MQVNPNLVIPTKVGILIQDSRLRGNDSEKCKTFKALGVLLCYPKEEWMAGSNDLIDLIESEKLLSADDTKALRIFVEEFKTQDIFDLQEEYVNSFDRVRSLSLHLFEHIHGESRDRGQAMVDLAERYQELGFTLAASELPDYLPVFLEYLSLLPKEQALEEIAETAHILVAIGKRLAERGSSYSTVFNCLIRLAGSEPEKVEKIIGAEIISFAELDKEWEDKPIEFLGAEPPQASGQKSAGCSSGGCGGGGCGSTVQKNKQGACS